jgi:hypothetical protein
MLSGACRLVTWQAQQRISGLWYMRLQCIVRILITWQHDGTAPGMINMCCLQHTTADVLLLMMGCTAAPAACMSRSACNLRASQQRCPRWMASCSRCRLPQSAEQSRFQQQQRQLSEMLCTLTSSTAALADLCSTDMTRCAVQCCGASFFLLQYAARLLALAHYTLLLEPSWKA